MAGPDAGSSTGADIPSQTQPTTTIRIADNLHRLRSEQSSIGSPAPPKHDDTGFTTSHVGGIYSTRSRRLSASGLSVERPRSLSRRRTAATGDTGDAEEGDRWQDGQQHTKQVFRGRTLLWLAYQSTGVIYGDIGTSPLYVFSSTFTSDPDYDSLIQVLSIILWSLIIVVTLKYIVIILHADNEGEGGTFSCYSLLTRFANITDRDPKDQGLIRIERYRTDEIKPSSNAVRSALEKSKFFRGLLKTIGVLAVSMVMSDGVLTPAQSVLGAVQGLNVVAPNITSATVIGTTCGILIVLFAIQPFGLTKLASTFAPIVILWLAFNAGFGIYNLVWYDHSVLKAFNPYYAFQFFITKKTDGWRMLGGVLLAFTGVEALFADLGAFSMHAIQLSWLCFCFPCLLLAYIGQAAYISVNPDAYSNPFFNAVPPGMLYPSLIVAILAAIVASQAIITATFQLISQIMKLSYCPQVKVVHTSKTFYGQLYVPFMNFLLLAGTILVTAVYNNTTRLGNAYGVCVMFVTFFDTCMTTLVALIVWKVPPYLVVLPWLFFASIDGLYLSSALTKVPDGAWFTLTVAGILATIFLLWRFGKENQWRAEAEDRFAPSHLITREADGSIHLTPRYGGEQLSMIRGFGVFFDKTGVMTPMVFSNFASKFGSVPDVMVFFHLHPVEKPTVADDERYSISRFTAIPGCYRLVIKHGFMDEVISPDLSALIYGHIRNWVIRQAHRAEDEMEAKEREGMQVIQAAKKSEDNGGVLQPMSNESAIEEEPAKDGSDDNENGSSQATFDDRQPPKDASSDAPGPGVPENAPAATASDPEKKREPIELRNEKVAIELARLDRAYATKVMYVVGKEQMRIKKGTHIPRRIVLEVFLWIRDNTRAKIANLRLAMERVVEVGFVKEI